MSSDSTSIQSQFNLSSVNPNGDSIYEFERFVLDVERLMLYENGEPVPLAPKVVETLLALVERSGEIVSKAEMMSRLWADAVVEDSNLTQNIYLLRKTLGAGADGRDLIETFRRRGYRFAGEIRARAETPAKSSRRNARSWFWIPAAVVVLAAALGSILLFWPKSETSARPSRTAGVTLKRLTPDSYISSSSISPDGKYVVYSQRQDGKDAVWVKDIVTGSVKQILPANSTEGYGGVYFSADGKAIYYATTRRDVPNTVIMRVPIEGGTPREIFGNVVSPLAVSPNGTSLAFVNGDGGLTVADADGSNLRVLKRRDGITEWFESWGSQLSFAPDGKRIAICGHRLLNGKRRVALTEIAVADGAERDLPVLNWDYLDSVQWIPDGSGLMVIARDESGSPFQIWRITYPSGETTRVTQDFADYKSVSIAADSRQMVATQVIGNLNIWVAGLDDRQPAKQITFGSAANDGYDGVEAMPDGRIVYTSPRSGNKDIWSMSPDGSNQRQLTVNAGANLNPSVSRDGRTIYFISDRGNSVLHVWKMDGDGGNPRQLTDGEGIDDRPIASPDGRWVYFVRSAANIGAIMRVPVAGGDPVRVTSEGNFGLLAVSPDGKLLAVRRYDESAPIPWQTGLISTETGETIKLFDEQVYGRISFANDGRSIIYTERNTARNLWQLEIESGKRRRLTNFESGHIRNFDLLADGKSLVIAHGNPIPEAVLISGF